MVDAKAKKRFQVFCLIACAVVIGGSSSRFASADSDLYSWNGYSHRIASDSWCADAALGRYRSHNGSPKIWDSTVAGGYFSAIASSIGSYFSTYKDLTYSALDCYFVQEQRDEKWAKDVENNTQMLLRGEPGLTFDGECKATLCRFQANDDPIPGMQRVAHKLIDIYSKSDLPLITIMRQPSPQRPAVLVYVFFGNSRRSPYLTALHQMLD